MSDTGANKNFEEPVKLVIDGREIVAEKGATLLQVALDNGVEIPHYCYHPKLSIDGSCRMCQVKIEGPPKLAIACNTPVADGMVVDTKSEAVAEAQKGVLELLLVNHPLDCPICDQAGECYLQDYSFEYGRSDSRTSSPRRKGVKRYPIGPRVVFDEERCILCRRCVRFTAEISKTEELRVFGIGDHSHIATIPEAPLDNDYSVNTADICPVGALLSRDFHHKRRVWFLEETESVCPSCSKGCNVKLGMFKNEIQRMVPRRNDEVNETWMCDHGRLRYAFAQDATRVNEAVVRDSAAENGSAAGVELGEAIAGAGARIQSTIAEHGAESVAVLGSGHLTNEELFRLAELARDRIATPHLDLVVPTGDSDDFLIQAQKVANARGAREMGVVPGPTGKDAAGILAAAAGGEIKLLYVVGSGDVLASLEPEAAAAVLASVETLIVQDSNQSEWTQHAHVVLPGRVWAEKDGSFTNHEGRVQRIRCARKATETTAPDGEIFERLAAVLSGKEGGTNPFEPSAAFAAIAEKVPGYGAMQLAGLGGSGRVVGEGVQEESPQDEEPAPAGS